MLYSFDAAAAATTKQVQYYEMCGTRGIWQKGWKASTEHGPLPSNIGNFDKDRWQVDVERKFAEALARD
jgi:arylsulfatase A-like enzyme